MFHFLIPCFPHFSHSTLLSLYRSTLYPSLFHPTSSSFIRDPFDCPPPMSFIYALDGTAIVVVGFVDAIVLHVQHCRLNYRFGNMVFYVYVSMSLLLPGLFSFLILLTLFSLRSLVATYQSNRQFSLRTYQMTSVAKKFLALAMLCVRKMCSDKIPMRKKVIDSAIYHRRVLSSSLCHPKKEFFS